MNEPDKSEVVSLSNSALPNKSWIKNNTNLKINNETTYSSVYRNA